MNPTALKTCLRCDWEGGTEEANCPNCGVPLYRAVPARASTRRAQTEIAQRGRDSAEPSMRASPRPEPGPEEPPLIRTVRSGPSARVKGVGAFSVMALLLTVSIATWFIREDAPTAGAVSAEPAPSVTTEPIRPPQPPQAPPPVEQIVAGIPFSIGAPIGAWERFAFSINRSIMGPQGAEAIIFWAGVPDGADEVSSCVDVVDGWFHAPMDDLATAVATAPGTELVEGPTNVTVGGFLAEHVTLTVRERQGCDPGYFFTWPHDECYGACWMRTGVGATLRLWIVDVKHRRIVIEAATNKLATPELEREVVRIVRSLRFQV